jgi:hypothetical protein
MNGRKVIDNECMNECMYEHKLLLLLVALEMNIFILAPP